MSDIVICIAPSAEAPGWARALMSAIGPVDLAGRVLVTESLSEAYESDAATRVLVMSSPAALATRSSQFPPGGLHWLVQASKSLAMTAEMINSGAVVLDAAAAKLDFPGLGEVVRSDLELDIQVDHHAASLGLYEGLPNSARFGVNWSQDVFSYLLGERLTGGSPEVDITGRARMLLHGPYIHLFNGQWRVKLKFEVNTEGLAIPLVVEWGHGGEFALQEVTISRSGVYELEMTQGWRNVAPAQVRIQVIRPSFGGRLRVLDCRVDRLPDADLDSGEKRG